MATCSNGHLNDGDARFCATCGGVVGAPTPTGVVSPPATGFRSIMQNAPSAQTNTRGAPTSYSAPAAPPEATPTYARPADSPLVHGGAGYASTGGHRRAWRLVGSATLALGVLLWFTVGPVSVPDVTGLPESDARSQIQGRHLKASVSEQYSETVDAGVVIDQDPSGGLKSRGSTTALIVSKGPKPVTVSVTLDVAGSNFEWIGNGNCYTGLTGYNDIHTGTQVELHGPSSELLGTGILTVASSGYLSCRYDAQIPGVPSNLSSYSVRVGLGARGQTSYSLSEMKANGWAVGLNLGS